MSHIDLIQTYWSDFGASTLHRSCLLSTRGDMLVVIDQLSTYVVDDGILFIQWSLGGLMIVQLDVD